MTSMYDAGNKTMLMSTTLVKQMEIILTVISAESTQKQLQLQWPRLTRIYGTSLLLTILVLAFYIVTKAQCAETKKIRHSSSNDII